MQMPRIGPIGTPVPDGTESAQQDIPPAGGNTRFADLLQKPLDNAESALDQSLREKQPFVVPAGFVPIPMAGLAGRQSALPVDLVMGPDDVPPDSVLLSQGVSQGSKIPVQRGSQTRNSDRGLPIEPVRIKQEDPATTEAFPAVSFIVSAPLSTTSLPQNPDVPGPPLPGSPVKVVTNPPAPATQSAPEILAAPALRPDLETPPVPEMLPTSGPVELPDETPVPSGAAPEVSKTEPDAAVRAKPAPGGADRAGSDGSGASAAIAKQQHPQSAPEPETETAYPTQTVSRQAGQMPAPATAKGDDQPGNRRPDAAVVRAAPQGLATARPHPEKKAVKDQHAPAESGDTTGRRSAPAKEGPAFSVPSGIAPFTHPSGQAVPAKVAQPQQNQPIRRDDGVSRLRSSNVVQHNRLTADPFVSTPRNSGKSPESTVSHDLPPALKETGKTDPASTVTGVPAPDDGPTQAQTPVQPRMTTPQTGAVAALQNLQTMAVQGREPPGNRASDGDNTVVRAVGGLRRSDSEITAEQPATVAKDDINPVADTPETGSEFNPAIPDQRLKMPAHTPPSALQHAPALAHHAARQIAAAAGHLPDRPVELSLNPEELGHVRLTISLGDSGMSVAIVAERPDTIDLMRRHIHALAQEFRNMGYGETEFQFSQQNQQNSQHPAPARALGNLPPAGAAITHPGEKADPVHLALAGTDNLDLRL